MHDHNDSTRRFPNLDVRSEDTRLALYQLIAEQYFPSEPLPLPPINLEDDFIETRTAEQAQLEIHYLYGRWFATWKDATPISDRERDQWEMVSITLDDQVLKISDA